MADEHTRWVAVAHLIRPQGRKGALLADLLTDFPERFKEHKRVYLMAPHSREPIEKVSPLDVESYWLPHGRNEGRIVLEFSDIRSSDEAQRFVGLDVVVPKAERTELTDGSLYVDDLVGCTVFDGEVEIGVVSGVQHMTTPDGKRRLAGAAPLLRVDLRPGEALIPFAREFVITVEPDKRRICMNLPKGLVDLNKPPASRTP